LNKNKFYRVLIVESIIGALILLSAHFLEAMVIPLSLLAFAYTIWHHLKFIPHPEYSVTHLCYLVVSGVFGFFFAQTGININFIFFGLTAVSTFNIIEVNKKPIIYVFLMLLFALTNSLFNKYSAYSSTGDSSSVLTILFPIALFVFIYSTIKNTTQLQLLYKSIFAAIIISAFDFLLVYLNGPLYSVTEEVVSKDDVTKVSGISNQVNQIANYIAYITPIAVYGITKMDAKNKKWGILLLGSLLVLLIFMSSRSGIALVALYFAFLIVFSTNTIRLGTRLVLLCLLSITYLWVVEYELPIFKKIKMQGDTGDEVRIAKISEAWEIFMESPLIGIGINNYTSIAKEKFNNSFNTHNTLLSVIAEQGLVGIILFISIFITPFINYVRFKKKYQPNITELNKAVIISCTLIFISFFTDHLQGNAVYYILIATAIKSTTLIQAETT